MPPKRVSVSASNGLRSARVVFGGARMHDLVAHNVPEAATWRVQSVGCEAIVAARSLGAGFHPPFGAQHLEVPADSRLGQLKDRLQLVHAELVPLEGEQKPAPRRVGEGSHLPEKGGGGQMLNPFIRIKGYSKTGEKSRVMARPGAGDQVIAFALTRRAR